MTIALILMSLLLAAPVAQAAPVITCHCFENRVFDAAQPSVADPFFLASAQNSLFAVVSEVEKKQVVRAKMTGALAADLWVAWFMAKAADTKAQVVEALRQEGLSWPEVASRLKLRPSQLDKSFAGILDKKGTTVELAATVVDAVLAGRCGANPAEIKKIRLAGADDQQTILAVFLGRKSVQRADIILATVNSGRSSWGSLLNEVGVSEENLEGEIRRLVR